MNYIFIAVIIFLIYVIVNLYRKLQIAEKAIKDAFELENEISIFTTSLLETYVKVYTKLKRIDRLGSFESDDEVGFVFKTLKTSIKEITDVLKEINERINNDSDREDKKDS